MFRKKFEKGFVLAYALFLLLIFSILGVSIVSMLTTSSVTSSEDFLSLQCLFIAESGAEIRIREELEGNSAEGKKLYLYNDYKNFKNEVTLEKVTTTPDGKELLGVYSTGTIFNIKRKIFIKFWK